MPQCSGIKRNGSRCTATVEPPQTYCWWHDPANEAARKRAAAKGGRGKANRKMTAIWDELHALIPKIEDESLTPAQANSIVRVYNTLLVYRRLELDVEERLELMPLIEEMEARRKEGGR